MATLKDLVERRKRTPDEPAVLQKEVAKIVKSPNDLTAIGMDLEAAGLMPDAEKNPELQAAIQEFREVYGFKTQLQAQGSQRDARRFDQDGLPFAGQGTVEGEQITPP